MLLPTALKKCWIYQVLRFTNNLNFLIGNFTGVVIMNFIPGWESEFVNQAGLETNLSEK